MTVCKDMGGIRNACSSSRQSTWMVSVGSSCSNLMYDLQKATSSMSGTVWSLPNTDRLPRRYAEKSAMMRRALEGSSSHSSSMAVSELKMTCGCPASVMVLLMARSISCCSARCALRRSCSTYRSTSAINVPMMRVMTARCRNSMTYVESADANAHANGFRTCVGFMFPPDARVRGFLLLCTIADEPYRKRI